MKCIELIGLLTICCLTSKIVNADVSYLPAVKEVDRVTVPRIKISGFIKQDDVQQFQLLKDAAVISAKGIGLSKPNGHDPFMVLLDSPGGSVSAAIALGRAIREASPMTVYVEDFASCVSACVFVLAGGVERGVRGRVGIHRPYAEDDTAYTVNDQKQNFADIEKNVKDYLSSVNVPTSLYDVMFRIPPEKVRYLSESELQEYNLSEDDPYYKAAEDAANAKLAGLPMSEYLRRNSECQHAANQNVANECFSRLFSPKEPGLRRIGDLPK